MSEPTTEPDTGSEKESKRRKKISGEQGAVQAPAEDNLLRSGRERGRGSAVRGRGSMAGVWARAERRPRPQGTLTQRALDVGTLSGLKRNPLAAGAILPRCLPASSPHSVNSPHRPALHFPPQLTSALAL